MIVNLKFIVGIVLVIGAALPFLKAWKDLHRDDDGLLVRECLADGEEHAVPLQSAIALDRIVFGQGFHILWRRQALSFFVGKVFHAHSTGAGDEIQRI